MSDKEINFRTAYLHFKCMGSLHSDKCLLGEIKELYRELTR